MGRIEVKKYYHTGIVVADVDWTVKFLSDTLGFEFLDKSSREPKNQEFVTGVTGIEVVIAYMRLHDQLFEISQYGGRAELEHYRPRMVDVGHYHLCLMVDDVELAVKRCLAYDDRITTLSPTPLVVDSGPNKGNRVIVVVLPDGMMIEFTNTRK